MRPRLPAVPFEVTGRLRDYFSALNERLVAEFDKRVERQEGALYITSDRPVRIVTPDGAATFSLTVTLTGELVVERVNARTVTPVGEMTADTATTAGVGTVV